jgi:outer membrane lipoprotein-sorting protein
MRSVPPRGSGWVRCIKLNQPQCVSRTHPLPRGGTDLMPRNVEDMRVLKGHIYFVFSLAILFTGFGCLVQAQNPGPSAQRILQRMTATYERMSSYQDSGAVRLVPSDPLIAKRREPFFQNVALQSDTLVSFKTYYLRPNRFRFQWKISSQPLIRESVIWSYGKRVYSWMPSESGDGTFEFTSSSNLDLQIDEALSASLGSVFIIPTLLLKNLIVFPFADTLGIAKQVSIVREELVDGETCYVIRADLSGAPWLLWVGQKSYLLRKTRTLYTAGSFHPSNKTEKQLFIADEVHTEIRINRGLPKSVFRYKPVLEPQDSDLTGLKLRRLGNPPNHRR